jgi:hypothetical protein
MFAVRSDRHATTDHFMAYSLKLFCPLPDIGIECLGRRDIFKDDLQRLLHSFPAEYRLSKNIAVAAPSR